MPDPDQEHRLYVVKQIRSMWLDKMNNGRTAARAYLYKSFVFILDKILQFKDVDRASQKGYRIELHTAESDIENIDADTPDLEQAYGTYLMLALRTVRKLRYKTRSFSMN